MRTTISHKTRFFLYSSPIDGRLYALVSYKDQAGPVNGKCFKLTTDRSITQETLRILIWRVDRVLGSPADESDEGSAAGLPICAARCARRSK